MGAMTEAAPPGPPARPETLADPVTAQTARRATSAELLQGARRLLILHDGVTYTLQVTRQNKLLLTK